MLQSLLYIFFMFVVIVIVSYFYCYYNSSSINPGRKDSLFIFFKMGIETFPLII
jgi:hypothetical protein